MIRQIGRGILRQVSRPRLVWQPARALSMSGWIPKWIWSRLPVEQTFLVEAGEGCQFSYQSTAGDGMGRSLFWRGLAAWEPETVPPFVAICRTASTVVDVGAHVGVFTLTAAAVNPDLRVLALEPVPQTFERLEVNLRLNGFEGRCQAVHAAVSHETGTTKLHVPDSEEFPASASLHPEGFRGTPGRRITVPMTTLDAACAELDSVDLVKIDVEGLEHWVLEGMRGILREFRPVLILECLPDGPFERVTAILREHDYQFYHLAPEGIEKRSTLDPDPEGIARNYICLHTEDSRIDLI